MYFSKKTNSKTPLVTVAPNGGACAILFYRVVMVVKCLNSLFDLFSQYQGVPACMFVTLFVLYLDVSQGAWSTCGEIISILDEVWKNNSTSKGVITPQGFFVKNSQD